MTKHRDLLAGYRDYLACLNAREWDRLGEFVAVHARFSRQCALQRNRMSLNDYREMLQGDARAVPDLRFQPDLLLVDNDIVTCRLVFSCTPRHRFLGFAPTGGQVTFAEHAFYKFENPRILEVWSVIDIEAIREQLSGSPRL
ncbi:ester cyclase [Mycobacterium asiaticum]|uniref:ester cyclase n=1 Tax=Mycobacterium asiaticum TaxID=1790 RepID=UPI0007EFE9D2|nr:ester cyclase [Mycobacterium asiaticum]OBK92896.1 ester cyclase [Mycobacterium asiaticum]